MANLIKFKVIKILLDYHAVLVRELVHNDDFILNIINKQFFTADCNLKTFLNIIETTQAGI